MRVRIRRENLESEYPERSFKVLHSVFRKKDWKSCTPEIKGPVYYNSHKDLIICQYYKK